MVSWVKDFAKKTVPIGTVFFFCYTRYEMKLSRRIARMFGPGLVTAASDDDPSGIATYTEAGAAFGLSFLWVFLLTLPLMVAVQEASARLALVTKHGYVKNLRGRVWEPLLWVGVILFVLVNAFNIGADVQFMAASASLLYPLPSWAWMTIFIVITLGFQVFLTYKEYSRYLKWLCLSLFAYVAVAFSIHINWMDVALATLVPTIHISGEFGLLFAVLGTTISPYVMVWQAAQEVEQDKEDRVDGCVDEKGNPTGLCNTDEELYERRVDIGIGMTFSNVIAWFIVVTAAYVLFANGMKDVTSPAEAALVLAPIAGNYASPLFTLGVIGTGMLGVPILAGSAAYALAALFKMKKSGLSKTWKQAPLFYAILVVITVGGACAPFFGVNPVKALIYAALGNALLAPLLLLSIIRLTNDKKLMGRYVNGRLSNVLLWVTFLLMTASLVFWIVVR